MERLHEIESAKNLLNSGQVKKKKMHIVTGFHVVVNKMSTAV